MTVSEKLITDSGGDKTTVAFIHDYLESRQTLLRTIPVSIISIFTFQTAHTSSSEIPFSLAYLNGSLNSHNNQGTIGH